jgi:uncharacterized lipoprotein YmbA
MKTYILFMIALLLTGCATYAPYPHQYRGYYNIPHQHHYRHYHRHW